MAKYIVKAYAAPVGKKVFRAHEIHDEKDFPDGTLEEFKKRGFVAEYSDEDYKKNHTPPKEDSKK